MNRTLVVGVLALVLVGAGLVVGRAAWGQSEPASRSDVGALKSELERLKGELEGIRGELKLIRELLIQRAAPPAQPAPPARVVSKVAVAGNPTLGKKDAPVTVIEFSDYQCPFCRRFFETTLPALKKDYVDTGKVRYVFRDFPLDQIHPQARKAAEAAHCAADQGKYWEMHDLLFQNQRELPAEKLKDYAQRLGLNGVAFTLCLDAGKHGSRVQKGYDDGVSAGVRGTPAFFVGKTRADDTIEGLLISGARPVNDFRQEIERLLAEK